jgi:RNA polymerase sigma-70 factor, ECF subfamily
LLVGSASPSTSDGAPSQLDVGISGGDQATDPGETVAPLSCSFIWMDGQDQAGEEFARNRPRLLSIAYRLLGSAWDAEDVVEEAAVRWLQTDRSQIREPAAFLTTVVTRLAIDQLRSARARRESYYGPWLPEPVLTDDGQLGPMETVAQRESVSLATMRLMERLSPLERAVFVLRTAFEVPYQEIAAILEISVDNARHHLRRARVRLADGPSRFDADAARHAQLFELFLTATSTGDLAGLKALLAEDVVAYNDGGGKARAALQPIAGRPNVLRFIEGLLRRYPIGAHVRIVEANGYPAALMQMGDQEQLFTIALRDGQISEIYGVLNPDKLRYTHRQLADS